MLNDQPLSKANLTKGVDMLFEFNGKSFPVEFLSFKDVSKKTLKTQDKKDHGVQGANKLKGRKKRERSKSDSDDEEKRKPIGNVQAEEKTKSGLSDEVLDKGKSAKKLYHGVSGSALDKIEISESESDESSPLKRKESDVMKLLQSAKNSHSNSKKQKQKKKTPLFAFDEVYSDDDDGDNDIHVMVDVGLQTDDVLEGGDDHDTKELLRSIHKRIKRIEDFIFDDGEKFQNRVQQSSAGNDDLINSVNVALLPANSPYAYGLLLLDMLFTKE